MMRCLSSMRGNNKRWTSSKTKHETMTAFEQAIQSRRSLIDKLLGRSPDGYCRFGFVRNPWDRMASLYLYLVERRQLKNMETVTSFKDFLRQSEEDVAWIDNLHSMKQQVDYFTRADGVMQADFLGHFEHLLEDIKELEIRLKIKIDMPSLNTSSNTKRDYKDAYDDEMIEIVARRFADDVSRFGYTFDHKEPGDRCSDSYGK